MTESDGETTGFFVRPLINILNLFNSVNVRYTQTAKTSRSILQYYKQARTVEPAGLSITLPNTYPQYFIELTGLQVFHYALVQHAYPC